MNVKKAAVIVLVICIIFIAGIVVISLNADVSNWFGFRWGRSFGGSRVDIDESAKLDLSGMGEVFVSLPMGNVTVETGEPGVTLKGYINVAEKKDKYLNVIKEGGKLSVEFDPGNLPLIQDSNIRMPVCLPQQLAADLKVTNSAGDINVDAIYGKKVTLNNASGNIKLTGCKGGVLSCSLSSGNITASDCDFTGVDADCTSGNVSIENVNGPIDVRNTSGNIDITAVSGTIEAGNASGNIDIRLSGEQVSGIKAGVSSGNITLRLNPAAAFELNASTSAGNVGCDFDILVSGGIDRGSLKGSCNGGGELVKLSVDSGNINVYKG
jgi:DUF4097 and DUF4098 domain-containing protein YvlB